MGKGIADRLARGDAAAIAFAVVVGVLVLRVGASDTMDGLPTAIFAIVIGALALGAAIRRVGGSKGWAVGIGATVGALSGAADAVIGSVGACAGIAGVHPFAVKSLACESAVTAVVGAAVVLSLIGGALAFVGATGTHGPSD